MAKKIKKVNGKELSSTSGGVTNLSYTSSPTNGIVTSDTGTDATIPLADGTNAGLLKPVKYTVLENTSGTNTGDENNTTIKSKLGQSTTSTDGWLSNTDWNVFNNKQTALGFTPVTDARTLTINDTTLDLTADRSWIVGDILSSGSYSNPLWITDIDWSKITGTPTTLSSYGITDGWRLGGNTLSAETIIGGTSGAFGLDIRTNNLTAFKVASSPASAVNFLTITSNIGLLSPRITSNVGFDTAGDGVFRYLDTRTAGGGSIGYYNSSGSSSITIGINASSTPFLQCQGGAAITFGTSSTVINQITAGWKAANTLSLGNNISTGNAILVGWSIGNNANFNASSGTAALISDTANLGFQKVAQSGTANLSMLKFSVLALESTSTGYMRYLDLAPTLTTHSGELSFLSIQPTGTYTGQVNGIISTISSGTNRYNLNLSGTAQNYLAGNTSIGTTTNTSFLTIGASTTAKASVRILAGSSPTTPNDGDIWQDGTDIKIYIGGSTKTFTIL